jgi:translation elongation factor EF-4
MDILVNGEKVGALSTLVHIDKAKVKMGNQSLKDLKETIPRQQFKLPTSRCYRWKDNCKRRILVLIVKMLLQNAMVEM